VKTASARLLFAAEARAGTPTPRRRREKQGKRLERNRFIAQPVVPNNAAAGVKVSSLITNAAGKQ